eukprot:g3766.t1
MSGAERMEVAWRHRVQLRVSTAEQQEMLELIESSNTWIQAIASTLGASEAIPQAELLALPEEPEVVLAESEAPMPGLGYISGRARKSFQKTALEVDSFAPSGAQVVGMPS